MSTMTTGARWRALMAALVFALLLAACGGDDSGEQAAGDDSAGEQPEGEEEAAGGGEGPIAVLLPDTASSARWEDFDRPAFEAAFEEAGLSPDDYIIQNAEGDPSTQQTQAEQALTQGASVIVLTNLDSGSGAAIHDAAEQAGVPVIDYDRLTLGVEPEVYISFDNTQVGRLQGETLVECVEEAGIEDPVNFAMLRGSPDDNNATLFADGANEVLDAQENFERVADQAVPDWDNNEAQTIFEQMLTSENNEIDAVLAANDGLGNAAIVALRAQNLNGEVPVTGQDATAQGLQNIALGDQCMTVYKPVNLEAQAAAEAAIALRNGEQIEAEDTVDNEGTETPAILLDPIAVTAENLSEPIDDGFVELDAVCTGDVAETEFCQSQSG